MTFVNNVSSGDIIGRNGRRQLSMNFEVVLPPDDPENKRVRLPIHSWNAAIPDVHLVDASA